MKMILLSGGESTHCYPFARRISRLTIMNRPLIVHQLEWLKENGFTEVAVVMSHEDVAFIRGECDGVLQGLRIHYFSDTMLRGPAGAMKTCQEFVGDTPFCVMNGNLYSRSLDLQDFYKQHVKGGGVATLATINPGAPAADSLENLLTEDDGAVRGFEILHASRDRRRPVRFAGIYAFGPEVLEHISPQGYVDIKEQLLPFLSQSGCAVNMYRLRGFHAEIDSLYEYFRVQHMVMREGLFDESRYGVLGDSIWCDEGVKVSPSAHLIGPVLLGRDCVIEDGACVVGPTVIGPGTRVLAGGFVRESILSESVTISKSSKVEYALVGPNFVTKVYSRIKDCVVTCERPAEPLVMAGPVHLWSRKKRIFPAALSPWYTNWLKRGLDILVALCLLIMSSPLMLVVAVAVKLDSSGPLFFRQRRCGLGGQEFAMVKFRTMCVDAEVLQQKLWAQKTVDGPMFKMERDPRVTRMGRFLRASSLDELPQLFNVLKGEMSLVGPRPLAIGEMRYSPTWRDVRLNVKPGITGLWQIHGRSTAAFHDWIQYDVQYVRNFSLWLDLKILLRTILIVLRRVGAH